MLNLANMRDLFDVRTITQTDRISRTLNMMIMLESRLLQIETTNTGFETKNRKPVILLHDTKNRKPVILLHDTKNRKPVILLHEMKIKKTVSLYHEAK